MTDIRFAANLKWLFTQIPLEERFDAAAAAGFSGVEVPDPYTMPSAKFATTARAAGVTTTLINTPTGPKGTATEFGTACIPGYSLEFRDSVLRGLDYAASVDCRLLHVVGGRVPDDVSATRASATYMANIVWAGQQAAQAGVTIVLEMQNQRSSPGFVLHSQREAAAVAEAAGSSVKLLFDFFHTQVAEGDVSTAFSEHLPLVGHIQIGDGPGRSEPGTGELAWKFIFDTIRHSGYPGWVGCEFQPSEDSAGVLSRLKRLM